MAAQGWVPAKLYVHNFICLISIITQSQSGSR